MSKGRTAAKRGTIPSILDRFAGLDLIQDADDLCLRESRLAHRNSFSAGILTGGTKLCAALLAGMITPNYIRLFWRLQWHFPMLHNIFPPTFSAFRHTGRAVTENSITRQFAYERCKAAPSVSVRIGALTVLVGKGAACIGVRGSYAVSAGDSRRAPLIVDILSTPAGRLRHYTDLPSVCAPLSRAVVSFRVLRSAGQTKSAQPDGLCAFSIAGAGLEPATSGL